MKLYDFARSGNGYKIRLALHQLQRPYEKIDIDILKRENRQAEFLKKNPHGRVPALETDDGRILPESNAILCYLTEGTPLMPSDPFERAQALGWMFFEQNNVEVNIANNRYYIAVEHTAEQHADEIRIRHESGMSALQRMYVHLQDHPFFVGGRYTCADIALYAYSHVAEEGRFSLKAFPAVRAWHERVRAQPRHIPMSA
jgi:glutathione S-transferase